MSKPFFIIGFMGSGKTHWGKIWASKLNLPFYDLDEEVEKKFKMPVKEIFHRYGEAAFREEEAAQLHRFLSKDRFLLSCGGGAPCFYNNMQQMKSAGIVVYLQASAEAILERVEPEIEKRPLLKNLGKEERFSFIQRKLLEREPVYELAHVTLKVENLSENSLNEY